MLVFDRNSVAYFYTVTENGFELSKVAEEDRKAWAPSVKLEVALHSFFGKPVQTVKVYCNDAVKLARALRKLEGVKACLEDDVRLSMRHLTGNNVVPCGWQQTGLG